MQEQAAVPGAPGATRSPLPHFDESPSYAAQRPGPSANYRIEAAQGASRAQQLATALGWFGIGLGIAELLAPRTVARMIGVPQHSSVLRPLGAREIASGVGILSRRGTGGWLWSRVAGDAMDLALLGRAARSSSTQRNRLIAAAAAVAGIALLDVLSSMQQTRRQRGAAQSGVLRVDQSISINRSPDECYRFWHDFENFPSFMKHLESVQITGENRVHWKARAPAGASVEWDAELIADQPGQYLAWRSLEGADIDNAGSVRFERAPGGRGTIMRVELEYRPPGGATGALIAKLFGEEPEQQIDEDLRRFKWLIETGEIPTTIGQPSGPRGIISRALLHRGEPG